MKKRHWVILVLFIFIFGAFLYYAGLVGSWRSTLPPAPPMNQAENNAAWLQQAAFWVQVALALGTFGAVACSLFAIRQSREFAKRQLYPRLNINLSTLFLIKASTSPGTTFEAIVQLSIINSGLVPCSIEKVQCSVENNNSKAAFVICDGINIGLSNDLFSSSRKNITSIEPRGKIVLRAPIPIVYKKGGTFETDNGFLIDDLFFCNAALKVEVYDHERNHYTSNLIEFSKALVGLRTLTENPLYAQTEINLDGEPDGK